MPSKAPAGYSGTPLAKKLGIAEGDRIFVIDAPRAYGAIVDPLPEVVLASRIEATTDLVHVFVTTKAKLAKALAAAKKAMRPDCVVWVSWPKKA